MLKHIKKHSHAFLFFLGGLFLIAVGPSLITFSNAATLTATATATKTDLTVKIAANQKIFDAAAAKASLSDTELAATMNIAATMLSDISKLTDTVKAKAAVTDFQKSLQKLTDNMKADDTMKDVRDVLLKLNDTLTQSLTTKTTAALTNSLTTAQKYINEANNTVKATVKSAATATGTHSSATTDQSDDNIKAAPTCNEISDCGLSICREYRKDNNGTNRCSRTCPERPQYNYPSVKSAAADTGVHASADTSALGLTTLSDALANANVSATLPATAKDTQSILNYFINFFQVAFQNLSQNLEKVVNYFTDYDQRVQTLEDENTVLNAEIYILRDAILKIAPETAKGLKTELQNAANAAIEAKANDTQSATTHHAATAGNTITK